MTQIETRKLNEREIAERTKLELQRLESKQRSLMLELEKTQREIVEASAKSEKANAIAHRSGAFQEPPIPTYDQFLAMAKEQCPGRPERECQVLAGRLHSAAALTSRIGVNSIDEMPPILGDAKDIDDHTHDIPAPTGPGGPVSPDVGNLPRYTKTYI